MSAFETAFLEMAKTQASRLEKQGKKEDERHPMDAFFESAALRAKKLPQATQGWLHMQFSTLMYSAESNEAVPQYAPVGQIPYAAPKVPNSHFLTPSASAIDGYVNVPTYSW
ncbi:hypothetical protein DPMN_038806 [Dreissena polymorpha]|uniref:Uncharacterized protein n=1 Tax=Dreissena polymorpha TaxID=45954 RepID=A0A9D4MEW9_DREPO|nr:hypothetical protein DPMN_038806 [Dreissena polymorpha]